MDEPIKNSIAVRLVSQAQVAAQSSMGPPDAEVGGAGDDNVLRHILPDQHLLRVPVDRIAPAREGQSRQDFNEERLAALAESLKRSGVREPIIVTPHGAEPGRFQIVAGERRWRAAQLAGLTEIPCIVDPGLIERKDKLLAQAEENLHRENLNAVEEAAVLAELMKARSIDVKEAAELLGKSPRQARRLLQIHGAAAPIKRAVARGQLDARVALEMVRIHNRLVKQDPSPSGSGAFKKIERLVERFVSEGWTMRKLERLVAKLGGRPASVESEAEDVEEAGEQPPPPVPRKTKGVVTQVPPEEAPKERRPVMERKAHCLILDIEQIEQHKVAPDERAALIELLEDLLFKVRRS